MVGIEGLEPPRLAAIEPKSIVATNYTISPFNLNSSALTTLPVKYNMLLRNVNINLIAHIIKHIISFYIIY